MKKLVLPLLALATVLATGCFVLSVAPFYTDKDLAFDPALLGSWRNAEDTNSVWNFENGDTNAYKLTIRETTETNLSQVHLFKLEGHYFIDMMSPSVDLKNNDGQKVFPPPIPGHTLARVTLRPQELRISLMNYEWFGPYLSNNPTALRHYLWKENRNESFPIVTADTAELQKFVLQHYANTNAWREETILKREPEKAK
jgi:hypothetical protein